MYRCILIIYIVLTTGPAFGATWSSKLGLPQKSDEDLARDFYTHRGDIGRWIRSLSDSSRARPPSSSCTACILAITTILPLLRTNLDVILFPNPLPNPTEESLVLICEVLNISSPEICRKTLERYIPSVSFIATRRLDITPIDVCAILVQDGSCGMANEAMSNWDISIEGNKPEVLTPAPLPEGHPTLPVLHVTDMHLDLKYLTGSHSNCDAPLCCREPIPANTPGATAAGRFGEYPCDTPLEAMKELFKDAASRYNNYAFVLMVGDTVPHAVWETTEDDNKRYFNAVAQSLQDAFPHTPVYPVLGNHEPHPCNMYAPRSVWDVRNGEFNQDWMYSEMATLYQRDLGAEAADSFRSKGYYTLITPQGLRLIVLNTNICYTLNFWIFYETNEHAEQLQWFSNTLAAAEKAKEVVYVVGHVPPGDSQCWSAWAAKFNEIVNRYENIIRAQFSGHTHRDELQIFFEKSASETGPAPRATNLCHIGPNAGPYVKTNPAYSVYHVDGVVDNRTWEIIERDTHYYDVKQANKDGKLTWKKYSARETYGLKTLRPGDLYDFVVRMIKDDALFRLWYNHLSRDADTSKPCDSTCRIDTLCKMVTTDMGNPTHCNRLRAML